MSRSRQRLVVWLGFSVLLLVGLFVHRDFGYSWDEETCRQYNGRANFLYLAHGDRTLLKHSAERFHGPAFEIVLFFLEKGLALGDTRDVYLMRHLATFLLFFSSVVVFHRLLRRRFHHRFLALAGASFLVLSPRIFADAFYNNKDVVFLAGYVFSLATLGRFLRRPTRGACALHALACGFLIDVRILGVVVPMLTAGLLAGVWLVRRSRGETVSFGKPLACYLCLTALFVTLFWPFIWRNPPRYFAQAFLQMSRYPFGGSVLYRGEFIPAAHLPWHYLPWWILITTPVFYSLLFAVGAARFLFEACRKPLWMLEYRTTDVAWFSAFFFPLAAVIVLRSTVYDGWRHLYFVYPAFLFLAVGGLAALLGWARLLGRRVTPAVPGFVAACSLPLLGTAAVMVRDHPYQNLYFNSLAGPDLQTIKGRYDLDYWGLSCRAGYETLLGLDRSAVLPVYAETQAAAECILILPPEQRARVRLTRRPEQARYYLSHYRERKGEFPADRDACSVRVGNAKVFVAQKLR
jgi:hypothetical protein